MWHVSSRSGEARCELLYLVTVACGGGGCASAVYVSRGEVVERPPCRQWINSSTSDDAARRRLRLQLMRRPRYTPTQRRRHKEDQGHLLASYCYGCSTVGRGGGLGPSRVRFGWVEIRLMIRHDLLNSFNCPMWMMN